MALMLPTRLVLASRSPRRAQLLRDAGYLFEQIDPPFDDALAPPTSAATDAAALTMALARRKAASLDMARQQPRRARAGRWILAADTVVVNPDGSLAGTPSTAAEARAMIAALIDRRHEVVTGVALRACASDSGRQTECFADAALVELGPVTECQLADYLATGQWSGKAGGYNLFERQASGWPIRVDGDPTTVVGLPMVKLARHLDRRSIVPTRRRKSSPAAGRP